MSESPSQLSKRKRVLGLDTSNIIEGSDSRRAKRRRDGSSVKVSESASSVAGDIDIEGDASAEQVTRMAGTEDSSVSELGIKLLDTLKKATNPSGINLATEFIKVPNKRQYPDYYVQIKQPIAFDDIRLKLEENRYASFQDVKADFDLCFSNAKRYNLKNSEIWVAARDLQRLATSTYRSLLPSAPEVEVKSEDEDGDVQDSLKPGAKEGERRSRAGRPPALYSKYQARLNKLIEKTDSEGNYHSEAFMQLVSKKDYPEYYQVITKPICFDQINRRIKDRKYDTPKLFMDDVEQIFTNAITFNEDHSRIWEDAKILQATFHTLCSDWRAEQPDMTPSSNSVPKLKLKVPPTKPEPVTVRLSHISGSVTTSTPVATPQPQQPQPQPTINTSIQPRLTPQAARPTPPTIPAHLKASTSRSPSVQVPHPPTLTAVELVTQPAGRRIPIRQVGIPSLNSWSVRLGTGETSVSMAVQLMPETIGPNEGPGPIEVKCNTAIIPGTSPKGKWDVPLVPGVNSLEVRVRGTGRPGKIWKISVDRTA